MKFISAILSLFRPKPVSPEPVSPERAAWSANPMRPTLIGGPLDGLHYFRGNGQWMATIERASPEGCGWNGPMVVYVWDGESKWNFWRYVGPDDTRESLARICFGEVLGRVADEERCEGA